VEDGAARGNSEVFPQADALQHGLERQDPVPADRRDRQARLQARDLSQLRPALGDHGDHQDADRAEAHRLDRRGLEADRELPGVLRPRRHARRAGGRGEVRRRREDPRQVLSRLLNMGRTLYEKIWDAHKVLETDDGQTLLHVARHLVHDGSVHGFEFLRDRNLKVRRPDQVFATPDHGVSTLVHRIDAIQDPEQRRVVEILDRNTREAGIVHFSLEDPRQGIVHVVGPEQGITQPGILLLCGDSHTSTHGALGALAFGAGASEITHVLATQTTWQRRPKSMRITVDGHLPAGVTAKDVILAIIAKVGANGAAGHVIEYAGSTIRAMSIEQRLTVCNMSIEAGARAGMVAPDETTYAYL